MCSSCIEKLKEAFELRSTCIKSDRLLRLKLLDLNNISKESLHLQIAHNVVTEESKLDSDEKLPEKENSPDFELLKPFIDFSDHEKILTADEIVQNKIEISKSEPVCRKNSTKFHMCTVCGKTFFTSGHLRSHEQTHKSSKDFTCHHCEKNFLMKSYLNRHMKSHLNERSYKCEVCQKGFNTSTTLGYHFRLVHSGTESGQTFQAQIVFKISMLQVTRPSNVLTAVKVFRSKYNWFLTREPTQVNEKLILLNVTNDNLCFLAFKVKNRTNATNVIKSTRIKLT